MEQHIRAVAILNIVYGGLGVLLALAILAIFGGVAGLVMADADPDAELVAPMMGVIGGLVFLCVAIVSVPAVVAGIGLLSFRSWARILTIIVSVLHLFSIPFGTALGIYGMWVLFKDETTALLNSKQPGQKVYS
jgi:hypothetical protein